MKIKKILTYVFAFIGVALLVCTSCEPVEINGGANFTPVDTPTIQYDTLSFIRGKERRVWDAQMTHISHRNGILQAQLGILPQCVIEEQDSVPYLSFNVTLIAETQDTLLPLGTYSTTQDKLLYILNNKKSNFAMGAKWFKEYKPYHYKNAIVHIGRDSVQGYYLESWVQMEEGENLYLYCPRITRLFRNENGELIYACPYYPDSRDNEDFY